MENSEVMPTSMVAHSVQESQPVASEEAPSDQPLVSMVTHTVSGASDEDLAQDSTSEELMEHKEPVPADLEKPTGQDTAAEMETPEEVKREESLEVNVCKEEEETATQDKVVEEELGETTISNKEVNIVQTEESAAKDASDSIVKTDLTTTTEDINTSVDESQPALQDDQATSTDKKEETVEVAKVPEANATTEEEPKESTPTGEDEECTKDSKQEINEGDLQPTEPKTCAEEEGVKADEQQTEVCVQAEHEHKVEPVSEVQEVEQPVVASEEQSGCEETSMGEECKESVEDRNTNVGGEDESKASTNSELSKVGVTLEKKEEEEQKDIVTETITDAEGKQSLVQEKVESIKKDAEIKVTNGDTESTDMVKGDEVKDAAPKIEVAATKLEEAATTNGAVRNGSVNHCTI